MFKVNIVSLVCDNYAVVILFLRTGINECERANPCQNGGTCTDLDIGYRCVCPDTHTGQNCTKGICSIYHMHCSN